MIRIFLRWVFIRIFGLRDLKKFINCIIKKFKIRLGHFGTILVSNDTQIERWVESMDAGVKSCPYWYSTRLFKGTELSPGIDKKEEYWVGIRETFLAPVIPIPICSEEIVFKIGENDDIYRSCFNKYGKYHTLLDHKEEYTHCIIEEADIRFVYSDVSYSNDQVWSSYD